MSDAEVTNVPATPKEHFKVVGIAVCWGQQDAYYVSFEVNIY